MLGKIKLLPPYDSEYKYGYVVVNKEPRRNVILYNNSVDRTTVSYARYLYETHLGYKLLPGQVVDHINEDKMDDRLENLQVITVLDNNLKSIKHRKTGRLVSSFLCGSCGKKFQKEFRNTHLPEYNSHRYSTYCSRSCAGKKLKKSIHLSTTRVYT